MVRPGPSTERQETLDFGESLLVDFKRCIWSQWWLYARSSGVCFNLPAGSNKS